VGMTVRYLLHERPIDKSSETFINASLALPRLRSPCFR